METKKTIHIIGGGVAGLATALGLQNKGIDYLIFEKSEEITYEKVGFGISANIFPILEEWDILEETEKLGARIEKFHFVNNKLKYLRSFNMSKPALSVKRKEFYQLLLSRLEKNKIHLNCEKSISDFNENEIVISADGINSQTRKTWYAKLKPRDSNQILWRGITNIKLENKFKNSYHDFIGNNLRFAIIDTGNNFYSWYIIKQKMGNENRNQSKTELAKLFQNYHPIVTEIIQKSENIYFSELKDLSPKDRKNLSWYKNNVLMIGDAIHPTTPNMANGGCLAIEDAYLLSQLLDKESINYHKIFDKFQKKRIKKVDAVVNQSWRFGKLLHQKNKALESVINWVFSMTPKFLFDKIYSTVLTKITK